MSQTVSHLQQFSPLLQDLQSYFLQIRVLAETAGESQQNQDILLVSKHALTVLDYALFAVDAMQTELNLTSVSAAAAAREVTERLRSLAKTYDVDLRVDITKTLEPVYANEAALKGILYGLASSLITSAAKPADKKARLIIAAQETTPKLQRLGVYSPDIALSPSAIKLARKLAGRARFVAPKDLSNSGLGLLVSDQLALAMGSPLKRFVHRGCKGVGVYLPLSCQLNFSI